MVSDVERLPFEKRLFLDAFLKAPICSQNRRINDPAIE